MSSLQPVSSSSSGYLSLEASNVSQSSSQKKVARAASSAFDVSSPIAEPLSSKSISLGLDETVVNDFIKDLRSCGWNGNATKLKKSICEGLLDLYGASITRLPESIGNLRTLRTLFLCKSEITSLPESFGKLSSLKMLEIEDTPIASLPESLGSLTSLTELRLNRSELSSLPESIGNLTQLKVLLLRNTKLASLPRAILNLQQLAALGLSGCPLVEIGKGATLGRQEVKEFFSRILAGKVFII